MYLAVSSSQNFLREFRPKIRVRREMFFDDELVRMAILRNSKANAIPPALKAAADPVLQLGVLMLVV